MCKFNRCCKSTNKLVFWYLLHHIIKSILTLQVVYPQVYIDISDSTVKPLQTAEMYDYISVLICRASQFILHNRYKSSERLFILLRWMIAPHHGLDCFLKTGISVSQRGLWVAHNGPVEYFGFIMKTHPKLQGSTSW